jgi:hypothetical protein
MEISSPDQHSKRTKTQDGKGNDSYPSFSTPSVTSSNEDEDLSPLSELVDGVSNAEIDYNEHNMCIEVVVAMCHGNKDAEGTPLLDIDASPWKNFKNEDLSKH